MKRLAQAAALFACGALLFAQTGQRQTAGPQPDGGYLLTNGWTLRPAGRQIPLDTLPMATEVTPDGRYVLVLHGGGNPRTVRALNTASLEETGRIEVPGAWLGLEIAANSRLAYISGGSTGNVYEISISPEGRLALARTFRAAEPASNVFLGDITFAPDQHLLYAADLLGNRILVVNPQSGRVIERFPAGRRPYRILFHPDGKTYFVTSWTDGTLYQYETINGSSRGFLRLGPHTTDMVWRGKAVTLAEGETFPYQARIFVAASNTNRVFSVGVTDSKELRLVESIDVSMAPRAPLGLTPSALALNADQSILYVTCSDANAVAVADVSALKTSVLGMIPVGRYPTASRTLPDGRLVVLNGLGVTVPGSASVIPPVDAQTLTTYTQSAMLSRFDIRSGPTEDSARGRPIEGANPASTIQHVVYIVRGNHSYNDLFGDNARFGAAVTPNQHKLAREFVRLDNFWVAGESAADGFYWSLSSIVPDFVQKLWPYAPASWPSISGIDLKTDPAAVPPTGFLWNQAAMAGLAVRNYGFFAVNPAGASGSVQAPRRPVLDTATATGYRGPDPSYPDTERAKAFLADFAQLESSGAVPRLLLVQLENDRVASEAAVADNDYALGLIVEGLSKSPAWPRTAVFVVESHAEGAPGQIENHRSPAFVLSAYTRRQETNSTFYNTFTVLRTIEEILGLRPMTQYDASAQPMLNLFAATPDPAPYVAERPSVVPSPQPAR